MQVWFACSFDNDIIMKTRFCFYSHRDSRPPTVRPVNGLGGEEGDGGPQGRRGISAAFRVKVGGPGAHSVDVTELVIKGSCFLSVG